MGLIDDAIGEFPTVARQGCAGKKKEVDCLSMSAAAAEHEGDFASAIEALKTAPRTEHATGTPRRRFVRARGRARAGGEAGQALGQFIK